MARLGRVTSIEAGVATEARWKLGKLMMFFAFRDGQSKL